MSIQKLSRFVFVLFVFVFFVFPLSAQQAAKQTAAGKLIEIKIPAPSLKGNLLGDVAEQDISVYLPPGYDAAPTKRYPVVYLLHGFYGTNKSWIRDTRNVPLILDTLIGDGKAREMIVVMPNGKNAFEGSFYLNSPVTGNWEDYIFREVVGYIDSNYRTMARPSSRGIGGHSMGGFGAVSLGMKHADVFSAIYALSPCCLGMEGEFLEPHPAWKRAANYTSKEDFPKPRKTDEDFYSTVWVAMSAVLAPNTQSKPFYADFLYREQDGKLVRNEAVAAKWKAKMPLYMVDDYKSNLLSLRGIFLDYGQNEQHPSIRISTALFSKSLTERGIPHTFEIYAGGNHTNKVKERLQTRVFEFFSERLDFSEK